MDYGGMMMLGPVWMHPNCIFEIVILCRNGCISGKGFSGELSRMGLSRYVICVEMFGFHRDRNAGLLELSFIHFFNCDLLRKGWKR